MILKYYDRELLIYALISDIKVSIQLILILWQKVRQTRIFAIVRVFPYYEEAKK